MHINGGVFLGHWVVQIQCFPCVFLKSGHIGAFSDTSSSREELTFSNCVKEK